MTIGESADGLRQGDLVFGQGDGQLSSFSLFVLRDCVELVT
jgi:hypothetical protein